MNISRWVVITALPACLALCSTASAQNAAAHSATQLAQTPPMGWISWNNFACNVSEQPIRKTADAMVSSGMLAAAYNYLTIDNAGQVSGPPNGPIAANPASFPP